MTSAKRVPLSGETATVRVPFADTVLTLSVSARGSLAGSLPQRLPWGIGIVGLVLTLGAVALTQRLIQGRRHAEALAGRLEEVAAVNRQLYAEQRGIAQTLQHALLPDRLPQLPGVQAVARYQAGVKGVEVGGDWYDLIVIDERRLLLVVGDVSGRGLRAATAMAALRYGIHAYAAQGDSPSEMLSKLSSLISVKTSGQMATVLCALVDVEARTVSITSAGHLLPLMIHHDNAEFMHADVGLPIGVDRRASYSSTTVPVPARATLLAFTDGLVERRGESIDVGLERLRSAVSRNGVPLEDLVTRVVEALRDDGTQDDTAIAGVQWLS